MDKADFFNQAIAPEGNIASSTSTSSTSSRKSSRFNVRIISKSKCNSLNDPTVGNKTIFNGVNEGKTQENSQARQQTKKITTKPIQVNGRFTFERVYVNPEKSVANRTRRFSVHVEPIIVKEIISDDLIIFD